MEDKYRYIWDGARPLVGTVVGVGIFGLPYVFSQAGYVVGLLELVIVAAMSLLVYLLFSDLLAINKQHVRFVAVITEQLGPVGRVVASIGFFGALWGAMLAYVIIGGQFAATLIRPVIGGSVFYYQLGFWLVSSLAMVGGTLFVRRLQALIIPLFFIMVVALTLFALPHLHLEYLTTVNPNLAFLPIGALIFAFSGFSAIPECREALGRRTSLMGRSLLLGAIFIFALYALFTFAVVGMTGPFTSVQAGEGLRFAVGPWLSAFVAVIGLCTVFTAFVTVGTSLTNSLIYDFKGRFLSSWWLAVAIPLCIFIFGARDFIGVIGATGGILGGVNGIILLVAYERARFAGKLPKRALAISQGLIAMGFILFAFMIILTIIELI
ncbi:MAG: aromatic amino acid transport family protein [Patescibacteria group bacterium]